MPRQGTEVIFDVVEPMDSYLRMADSIVSRPTIKEVTDMTIKRHSVTSDDAPRPSEKKPVMSASPIKPNATASTALMTDFKPSTKIKATKIKPGKTVTNFSPSPVNKSLSAKKPT
jgi:hypothetical protein